ncbi:hypothetical protein HWV00_20800 (plasmid) [Moritella sp. 24]|uniref:hypothetical protein n=1 Tax=Moritella sp. 24 TaxID=2746230 RepID=UPI001BAB9CB8|nr:hypothetical protein [Moritella sp. 24]QUM78713.1 hypothetical protein HWV00_20800 [Moritella sp. 24]
MSVADLEKAVNELTASSNEQTQASAALSTTVSEKIADIDKKVDLSISQLETEFEDHSSKLTIISTDGYRKAIEDASGGLNTVIYDAQGNPNVMYVQQRFNLEDANAALLARTGIDFKLGVGTPTAFLTNGVPRSEIFIGRFLASSMGAGTAVVGGVQPKTSVNFDAARELCTRKGDGWHLMSIHEQAALALYAFINNTIPRGNTNYGRSHECKWESARRSDNGVPGEASGTGRSDTGKGPASWNHDGSPFGVADLVGNTWEHVDQLLLDDGQFLVTPDNNPGMAEAEWSRLAAFLDSTSDSQSGNVGSPIFNSSVTKRNGPVDDDGTAHAYMHNANFAAMLKTESYAGNELLRQLLIESEDPASVGGSIYARNHGARSPRRGGSWNNGSSAGLGALDLYLARTGAYSNIGFRPAFFG